MSVTFVLPPVPGEVPKPPVKVQLIDYPGQSGVLAITFNDTPVLFIHPNGHVTRGIVPRELQSHLLLDEGLYLQFIPLMTFRHVGRPM